MQMRKQASVLQIHDGSEVPQSGYFLGFPEVYILLVSVIHRSPWL